MCRKKKFYPTLIRSPLIILFLWIVFIMLSCNRFNDTKEPVDYVNPLIGTKGPGNVLPGPLRPHGMVKLGPDCVTSPLSGYEYDDSTIVGFSHTHLEGTGGGAYGNVLLLPMVGDLDAILRGKCFSKFHHATETASPGYYAIMLNDYGVRAELTATEHAGFHRYTFPATDSSTILIDVSHALHRRCRAGSVEIIGDSVVQGYGDYGYPVWFYAQFSRPFHSSGTWSGCRPVQPFVTIPADALAPGDGSGRQGLKGEYFNNKDMSGQPAFTRIDSVINFRWGMNRCDERLGLDNFSIRWTGTLTPPVTGLYLLRLETDDGVRFFLDDSLLIDQWVNRGETADVVSVKLEAGRAYNVRIEYFENVGVSLARFKWDLVPEMGELHFGAKKESGTAIGAFLKYKTKKNDPILVKVGISYISMEQARRNVEQEIPNWDFDAVRQSTRQVWNRVLSRIKVSGGAESDRVKFYSALYRSLMMPTDYTEDDRYYSAASGEGKVYPANGRHFYSDDWCTWDTFRTTHPLQTIVEPERQADMAQSFVNMYEESGCLSSCPGLGAGCGMGMIGNHAISVITDIFRKGFTNFDYEKAYQAMRHDALDNPGGSAELSSDYLRLGYVAFDYDGGVREKASASITLERAYDDWCLAQMAQALGKTDDYQLFMKRSRNYRNLFDASVGFIRPRYRDGTWKTPFDPGVKHGKSNGFTESNAWQMTFFAPQDIPGLIELLGGKQKFVKKLDEYFKIGQHNQGNEPGFINPFLFNYANALQKTQKVVRDILQKHYGDGPDGLEGNDDSGAMSAWYVLAAMGLYPVCPGAPEYTLLSPLFERIEIRPSDNAAPFIIEERKASKDNNSIQSAWLNGKKLNNPRINHSDIARGGKLVF